MLRPRPALETPPPATCGRARHLRLVEADGLDQQLRRILETCPSSPRLEAFVLGLGQPPRA